MYVSFKSSIKKPSSPRWGQVKHSYYSRTSTKERVVRVIPNALVDEILEKNLVVKLLLLLLLRHPILFGCQLLIRWRDYQINVESIHARM